MMKILITPLLLNDNMDEAYYLCKNIISVLNTANHTTAILAPTNSKFHHTSFYSSPKPSLSLRSNKNNEKSYEDYLFNKGATNPKYLKEDLKVILSTIKEFKPDVILTHDRLSSIIASKLTGIPVYAIVHSSIFTYKNISSQIITGLNEVLSANGFSQVFNLEEFYKDASRLFVFGPIETSPFVADERVVRIGLESIYPPTTETTSNVFVYLNDIDMSKRSLKKLLTETFKGAPYKVNAFIGKDYEASIENINFINSKLTSLYSSSICIHDGNGYIFNTCLACGIPQLIVSNKNFINLTNGLKAQRNRFGFCLFRDEFSMESLYEAFSRIYKNDLYKDYANIIKASSQSEGDLTKILNYF